MVFLGFTVAGGATTIFVELELINFKIPLQYQKLLQKFTSCNIFTEKVTHLISSRRPPRKASALEAGSYTVHEKRQDFCKIVRFTKFAFS